MEHSFAERLDWAARFDALVDELDVEPGWETRLEPGTSTLLGVEAAEGASPSRSAALDALTRRLLDAESAQFAANRALAAQLAAVNDVLDLARRTPLLYLQPAAVAASDAAELAVRAAAEELAMRLHVSATTVRNQAHEAEVLQHHLPRIWDRFASGTASYVDARSAVEQVCGLTDDREALASFDLELANVIGTMPPARFRARARALRARLERDELVARHARAMTERRVIIEATDDGMSWVQLYVDAVDAARIRARLDATAKRQSSERGESRTRDQLRADAAVAWLTGDGTLSAASVDVMVTVPVLTVIGAGDEPATLDGYGPIDPATARQLFADAPSFLRVAVDPFTSAPRDLDRTRYRPTRAQRRWLALRYGTCAHPGCGRLAVESDLDHLHDWFFGGATNESNLIPLCHNHHRLKHATKFTVARAPDGAVSWTSPTGYAATGDPPF